MDPWTKEGGQKADTGKPPMSLLDRRALEEIAQVLAFGAGKYDAHNWRKGIRFTRLTDAALRHLMAFVDGENKDPETGLSHVAHASCCLMFLLWMEKNRPDLDDRFKVERATSALEAEIAEAMVALRGPRTADMAAQVEASGQDRAA